MSEYQFAGPGWVAIENDPDFGIEAHRVRFFEISDEGVTPLVADVCGVMVEPSRHTTDVIRASGLDALRIAALRELLRLGKRATSQKQIDGIAEAQALIMRGPGG